MYFLLSVLVALALFLQLLNLVISCTIAHFSNQVYSLTQRSVQNLLEL